MKIIIANWKMNPQTLEEARQLFTSVKPIENVLTVICPPFVYLEELAKLQNDKIILGAQDVFWEESGAFTGEISIKQLSEFGVKYVLVGHSERRALGETDEMINKKLLVALKQNIRPILLVGEKEKGESREDVLIDQLSRDLAGVESPNLIICYEPVWAISSHSPILRQGFGGQGRSNADTPESALEAISSVREILVKMFSEEISKNIPILYGGSANAGNIREFLKHEEIAGAVVGSASLKPEEFNKILEITSSL